MAQQNSQCIQTHSIMEGHFTGETNYMKTLRSSRFTKVIKFNVVLYVNDHQETSPTQTCWIGVARVAKLCRVFNDETSAYSKFVIPG